MLNKEIEDLILIHDITNDKVKEDILAIAEKVNLYQFSVGSLLFNMVNFISKDNMIFKLNHFRNLEKELNKVIKPLKLRE